MFNYQIIIMISLCLLCLNEASFKGALVLFISYCIYAQLITPMQAIYYYSCASLLAFIVGLILHRDYIVTAICAYSLTAVNILGFFLWANYYEPTIYDNISSIILIIQALSLLPKGLLNGFRHNNQHSLVESSDFNGD